jgi:adenosylhomocysteine nucleosidase
LPFKSAAIDHGSHRTPAGTCILRAKGATTPAEANGLFAQVDTVIAFASRRRVVILAPMPSELRSVARALSLRRTHLGEPSMLCGKVGGMEILATTTGVGTGVAARKAEEVLRAGPVTHLVVVGIAGGIGPTVAIGDLIVPEVVLDLATGAEYIPRCLGRTPPRGKLATSDRLISDPAEADHVERQGVIAVDMETAAIAAVCERQGCPWSVFRAISDRADDSSTDPAVFGLAGPDGRPRLGAVARFVLTRPGRVPQLATLARGLTLATRVAAGAAARALAETYPN